MTEFASRTAEIKYLILEYMRSAGSDHDFTRKEIISYVSEKVGSVVGLEGIITGSIKQLVLKDCIIQKDRGVYVLGDTTESTSRFEKIHKEISKSVLAIKRASTFNVLELTEDERLKFKSFGDKLASYIKVLDTIDKDLTELINEKPQENIDFKNLSSIEKDALTEAGIEETPKEEETTKEEQAEQVDQDSIFDKFIETKESEKTPSDSKTTQKVNNSHTSKNNHSKKR